MGSTIRRLRYRGSRTALRVPLIWARHRGFGPNDVFLASFPRSGNTWLRFVLGEVLTRDSVEFESVNRIIPEVGLHGKAMAVLPGGGRLIKTHELYRREYQKVVYVVRDVRDVVLSEYSRKRQLGIELNDLDGYLPRFLRGTAMPEGAWHNHIHCWLDCPLVQDGNLLLIRFEEMRKNLEDTIAKIVTFLNLNVDMQLIREAIANNSVEMMRIKEDRTKSLEKSTREEGRFIRKGSVGGWRAQLTDAQARLIEQHTASALERLGYPIGTPVLQPTVAG